jgi:hypothetical protein
MKRVRVLVFFIATLSFASCSSISKVASSNTVANAEGVACGKVLTTMFNQYKSSGKVDVTNSNTWKNVMELGSYCTALNKNKADTSYKQSFASGLVTGSNGLLTTSTATSAVNSLLSISGLSGLTSGTSSTSTTAKNVTAGLTSLFNSWKK